MAQIVTPATQDTYRWFEDRKSVLLEYLINIAPNRTIEFDTATVDLLALASNIVGDVLTYRADAKDGKVTKITLSLGQPTFEVPYPGIPLLYDVLETLDEAEKGPEV